MFACACLHVHAANCLQQIPPHPFEHAQRHFRKSCVDTVYETESHKRSVKFSESGPQERKPKVLLQVEGCYVGIALEQ